MVAEHPNEALVRRFYAAFSSGDTDTMTELTTPDLVFSVPGNSRISGEHRSRDGVFALFGLVGELSDGTVRVELESIEAEGDTKVVSSHRVTAERGDEKLDIHETETWTMEDGKIARVDEAASDQAAADAFWG